MSTLDMRTLFISAAVVALLMGVIVLAFGGNKGAKAPLRSWGWSLLALMTGFTVIGLQDSLNRALANIVGNTLLTMAGVLLVHTAKRMRGLADTRLPWLLVPLIAFVSLMWSVVWDEFKVRSVLTTGVISGLLFWAAYIVGRDPPFDARRAHRIAAATIGAYAAILAIRSVLTFNRDERAGILQPTAYDVLSLLAFQAFAVSATLGLMWIEIQRLEGELSASPPTIPSPACSLAGLSGISSSAMPHARDAAASRSLSHSWTLITSSSSTTAMATRTATRSSGAQRKCSGRACGRMTSSGA